jgi:hypothetical protein
MCEFLNVKGKQGYGQGSNPESLIDKSLVVLCQRMGIFHKMPKCFEQ